MSLRARSFATLALVVVLLILSVSTAFWALRGLTQVTSDLTDVSDPKERAASDFKFAVTSLYEYQGHYVLGEHVDPRRDFLSTQRQVDQRLDDLSMLSTDEDEHQLVVMIRNRYNGFLDSDTACWAAVEAGDVPRAIKVNQTEEAAKFRSIVDAVDQYIVKTRKGKASEAGRFAAITRQAKVIDVVLVGSAVVVALAFARMIRRVERQERTIRQHDERFRSLMRHSSDVILVVAEDGVVLYASPSATDALVGRDPTGLRVGDVLDEASANHVLDALRAGTGSGGAQLLDLMATDGGTTFEAVVTDLVGTSGVDGVVLNMRDVTERNQLAQERMNAQKLESVGRLAAGIAHEINTPLQFMRDNVQFVRGAFDDLGSSGALPAKSSDDNEETAYLLAEIPTALEETAMGIDRVRTIVDAMRMFGRPDSDDQALAHLGDILATTVTVATSEYTAVADLDLDVEVEEPIMCWAGELSQALLHLIVNAAHAIGDVHARSGLTGRIVVRARTEGEGVVVVSVTDNGTGIPADVQPHIFDPFFTTKEVGRGSGQGLAFVRSTVVDRHRGTIDYETSPDGTTFTVRLPVAGARAA